MRPVEVVEDYENVIWGELNLQSEGANTTLLRHNFENSPLLYVPEVHWPFSNENVLVIERINGLAVNDVKGLEAAGVELKVLVERGVEIFLPGLEHNFFMPCIPAIFCRCHPPAKPAI